MRSLTLRLALAVLAALAIAACSDDSPTSPTSSSGTTPSALADGDSGQRQAADHKPKHGGGGGPPGETTTYSYYGSPNLSFPIGQLEAESSPVNAGPRILLGTSEDNDQVVFGPVVLGLVDPMGKCFNGPMNFGGSLRDFNSTPSCALGFSWTLDCERVLAGGVSR